MKLLKKHNCLWNDRVFTRIVVSGNLEIMQWLLENKAPWSRATFYKALENGNQKVINWLVDNNCPRFIG